MPPDLAVAIYDRVRAGNEAEGEGRSWHEIVRDARELGIFTAEEAEEFLRLIAEGIQDVA